MSGLYDNLGTVRTAPSTRVKKEPVVSPASLYAGLDLPNPAPASASANLLPKQSQSTFPNASANSLQTNQFSSQKADPLNISLHQQQQSTNYQTNALFVGNLKWWTRDQDLLNIFSQFGTVTALKIHADKVNGKSKGYAYIEYSSAKPEAALSAKQKLHGYQLHGGKLTITFASPDKIKLPEFTNTPYVPTGSSQPQTRTQAPFGSATNFPSSIPNVPGLPNLPGALPSLLQNVSLPFNSSSILKQLGKLSGGKMSALLKSFKKRQSNSRSRSSSYSSNSRSNSRSASRNRKDRSRSRERKNKRRIIKKENSERRSRRDSREKTRRGDRGKRSRRERR